eukprot:TRINITY_DN33_c0_g1_i11.p1 TRINITY_DN33_c0_g1~~TRINITY_DN33_c0_g1_i11.p1  ORF type:complete len:583 (+),score=157.24 TRINITY_DN33_c0_g1_i11:68-1816(+)
MRVVFGLLLLCSLGEGAALPMVREVTCTAGKTILMEVEEGNVAVDGVVQFQSRVYRVDGEITFPAATIRMQAGEVCNLRVVNKLKGPQCTMVDGQNGFHCPDITSLHTHGLHVSPQEDNIDTHIQPGQEHTYTYTVPGDHLMGTHWYHAHHHGSTSLQALGGLAGILLVDPAPSYTLPLDLQRLYNFASVPPLILNYLALGKGRGNDRWKHNTHTSLVDLYKDVTVPLNLKWASTTLPNKGTGNFYVVNGVLSPDVEVIDGDATLLRMVHAGDGFHLTMELDDPEGLCNMTLLARDGVFHATPYLDITTIVLIQGTRADVAVQCNLPAGVSRSTINMVATKTPSVNPAKQNTFSQASMMKLNVRTTNPNIPTTAAPLPAYLTSLMDEANVQVGGVRGVKSIEFRNKDGGINGKAWPGWGNTGADRYTEEFCLDQTYEYTLGGNGKMHHNANGPILSGVSYHPYHQHVNHFQVVNGGDSSGIVLRDGEWRDVAPTWKGVGTLIRMRPSAFVGEVVLHCHLLQHEDRGMMSLMNIKDCGNPRPGTRTATPGKPPAPAGVVKDHGSSLAPVVFSVFLLTLFSVLL